MIELKHCDFLEGEPTEVKVMKHVDHPSIAKVVDWYVTEKQVIIVMPFYEGNNLCTLFDEIGNFPENFIKEIALKLIPPIQCLHDHGIVHQDIKPGNILYDTETGELTLLDFGTAKGYEMDGNEFVCTIGTPGYVPPELENELEVHGPEIDMYSFGATLFALYYGVCPNGSVEELSAAYETRNTPYKFYTFLSKCLSYNPNKRPKWDDIFELDWLKDCDPEAFAQLSNPLDDTQQSKGTTSGSTKLDRTKKAKLIERKKKLLVKNDSKIKPLPGKKKEFPNIRPRIDTSCPSIFLKGRKKS